MHCSFSRILLNTNNNGKKYIFYGAKVIPICYSTILHLDVLYKYFTNWFIMENYVFKLLLCMKGYIVLGLVKFRKSLSKIFTFFFFFLF